MPSLPVFYCRLCPGLLGKPFDQPHIFAVGREAELAVEVEEPCPVDHAAVDAVVVQAAQARAEEGAAP